MAIAFLEVKWTGSDQRRILATSDGLSNHLTRSLRSYLLEAFYKRNFLKHVAIFSTITATATKTQQEGRPFWPFF